MPEANVLYSVTAAVVVGLVAWVAVVLKSAKEPWARPTPKQVRGGDVPTEPEAKAVESEKASSMPPSSSLPRVLSGSAGGAGADATAEATAVVVAKKTDVAVEADAKADADADAKADANADVNAEADAKAKADADADAKAKSEAETGDPGDVKSDDAK